jgi:hypothetical protein
VLSPGGLSYEGDEFQPKSGGVFIGSCREWYDDARIDMENNGSFNPNYGEWRLPVIIVVENALGIGTSCLHLPHPDGGRLASLNTHALPSAEDRKPLATGANRILI